MNRPVIFESIVTNATLMYRVGKVAKWCNLRPSDLLEMREAGFSSTQRFSIDESVVDFMQWVESKANEKKPVPAGKQLGKNQTWGPKYDSIGDILAEYGHREPDDTPVIDRAEIDALLAGIDAEHEPEF